MPQLLLASVSGAKRAIPLVKERTQMGRRSGCDVRIDEPGVAPVAGFIICSLGDVFAVAEREEAPLIINGEPSFRRLLIDGDVIHLGSCRLSFQADEREAGSSPSAFFDALSSLIEPEKPAPADQSPAEMALDPPPLPAAASPADEPEPESESEPEPPADSRPAGAWALLRGVAGHQKGSVQWLIQDLFLLSCSGSSAVITRRSGSVFLTPADGPAPLINRKKANSGPSPIEFGALIGLGASVFKMERPDG